MARQATAGDRLRFDGDNANCGDGCTVESSGGGWLTVRWDESGELRAIPSAITSSPRWHFEDEWRAERKAALAQFLASVEARKARAA